MKGFIEVVERVITEEKEFYEIISVNINGIIWFSNETIQTKNERLWVKETYEEIKKKIEESL